MLFAYPSGEERGILLIQVISTCLRGAKRNGGGGSVPCGPNLMKAKVAGQRLEPVTGQHMHIVLACK
jgi:hypothetical protein